jgi:hypothetical protein
MPLHDAVAMDAARGIRSPHVRTTKARPGEPERAFANASSLSR